MGQRQISKARFFRNLRKTTREPCPETVIQSVFDQIGVQRTPGKLPKHKPAFTVTFRWMAAATAAATATLVMVLMQFGTPDIHRTASTGYSENQIREANAQLKESLGLVHRFSRKSQLIITRDVLNDSVAKPIDDSIEKIFISLKGV